MNVYLQNSSKKYRIVGTTEKKLVGLEVVEDDQLPQFCLGTIQYLPIATLFEMLFVDGYKMIRNRPDYVQVYNLVETMAVMQNLIDEMLD